MIKSRNRILAAAMLLFMLTLLPPGRSSADGTLRSDAAQSLYRLGVIAGYEDGDLHLEYKIKRSEFATLMVKLMGYDQNIPASSTAVFKDLNSSHWAHPYLMAAHAAGMIAGYPDGTIGPDNRITQAEALTILIKALGYGNTVTGAWPDNYIKKAAELGISANAVLPSGQALTREDVCMLLYNSLTVDLKQ